jgi:alpha-L-rhamnosidase
MFGGGLVWFYRKLAGMDSDFEEPAYRHIIFRPQPVDDLSFVKYYNNTSYGKAGIFWKKDDNNFSMEITVPVGTYATVYVPASKNQDIFESGEPISNSKAVKAAGEKNGYKVFSVNSGTYKFEVE